MQQWGVGVEEGYMTLFRSRTSQVGDVIVKITKATTKSITFQKTNGKEVTCAFKKLETSCCTGKVADMMNLKSFKFNKDGFKKFTGKSAKPDPRR